MGRNLIVLSTLLLGAALMTSGAHADGAADTCQKAPKRACVLEVASANADKIAIPYVKASVLAVIARDQQRFGLIDAGRATLQRAEEAQEAIPEDFPQGNIVGAIAGAMAEMGDTAAAVEVAKNTKTPFARAFAYGGIGMALQRKGKPTRPRPISRSRSRRPRRRRPRRGISCCRRSPMAKREQVRPMRPQRSILPSPPRKREARAARPKSSTSASAPAISRGPSSISTTHPRRRAPSS